MTPNAFIGWTCAPTENEVAAVLGHVKPLWDSIAEDLADELGLTGSEWKCAGRKYGWSLRLKKGKRNILYLSPCEGCFRVAVILGDKAMDIARASDLNESAKRLLADAPHYPEGTGIRLEVSRPEDLLLISNLAKIKLAS